MSKLHHYLVPHHSNNQRARLLHPTGIFAAILVFLISQLFIRTTTQVFPDILGYASQIPVAEVIRLTNVERTSRGLSALSLDTKLSQAASQKAADMFAKDYWAHVSPTGTQPWFFITESGYSYRYAGENLARDFSDPQSVVTAWMNSPTHRENLLSSRYQEIGVAVVDGRLSGRDTTLVVQMFGTKLSAQPSVGGSSSFAVRAQVEPPAPVALTTPTPTSVPVAVGQASISPRPLTSPFNLTRYIGLGILLALFAVLALDIIIVNRRKLVRWTSKSFAHFIFIAIVIAAAATVIRGQII